MLPSFCFIAHDSIHWFGLKRFEEEVRGRKKGSTGKGWCTSLPRLNEDSVSERAKSEFIGRA